MPTTEAAAGFETKDVCLEYKRGTNDWVIMPGMADITADTSPASATAYETAKEISRRFGRVEPPTLSVTIPVWQLAHPSTADMDDLQASGDTIQALYHQSKEEVLFPETASGNTIAIATDGSITVVGSDHVNFDTHPEAGPGAAIKIGTDYYVIKSVADPWGIANVTLAANPSSAVSASTYSIVLPPWYRPAFNCVVTNFSTAHPAVPGVATATLDLAAKARLPSIKIGAVVRP